MLKKILKNINNGVVLVILGILHTNFTFSEDGFGSIFERFSETSYFQVSKGLDELPATAGITNFETMSAFWFFYFGLFVIVLGILLFFVEKEMKMIPHSFTISYILAVLIGCYMIPNSGMTFLMLPHAVFMLIYNYFRGNTKIINN